MDLSETDIRSLRGKAWIIRSDASDVRPWLASAPVCTGLAHHMIRHLAVADMPAPFEIVRTHLGGSYFLASLAGEGRVLVLTSPLDNLGNNLPLHPAFIPLVERTAQYLSRQQESRVCTSA